MNRAPIIDMTKWGKRPKSLAHKLMIRALVLLRLVDRKRNEALEKRLREAETKVKQATEKEPVKTLYRKPLLIIFLISLYKKRVVEAQRKAEEEISARKKVELALLAQKKESAARLTQLQKLEEAMKKKTEKVQVKVVKVESDAILGPRGRDAFYGVLAILALLLLGNYFWPGWRCNNCGPNPTPAPAPVVYVPTPGAKKYVAPAKPTCPEVIVKNETGRILKVWINHRTEPYELMPGAWHHAEYKGRPGGRMRVAAKGEERFFTFNKRGPQEWTVQ